MFQVILNFRKVVADYLMPFSTKCVAIDRHFKSYFQSVQESYNILFKGLAAYHLFPTVMDGTHFWMDDCLTWKPVNINSTGGEPIILTLIDLPIGLSRTRSLSTAIHPIVELSSVLKIDQRIELCFIKSLLNTPVRFSYIMGEFVDKVKNESFRFDDHPYFDWLRLTLEKFDGEWQGGPYPRYSCSGLKQICDVFGSDKPCDRHVSKEEGSDRLKKIIKILYDFLRWVDSWDGKTEAEEIPMNVIERQFEKVADRVNRVASCNFRMFRLGVFLTMANACRLTKSGVHLCQLVFPVNNTAADKHLRDPMGDMMSSYQAERMVDSGTMKVGCTNDGSVHTINKSHYDVVMKELSVGLGYQKYRRKRVEMPLCESYHSRHLEKCEVYRHGYNIYDEDENGVTLQRRFGRFETWEEVQRLENGFAFLGIK